VRPGHGEVEEVRGVEAERDQRRPEGDDAHRRHRLPGEQGDDRAGQRHRGMHDPGAQAVPQHPQGRPADQTRRSDRAQQPDRAVGVHGPQRRVQAQAPADGEEHREQESRRPPVGQHDLHPACGTSAARNGCPPSGGAPHRVVGSPRDDVGGSRARVRDVRPRDVRPRGAGSTVRARLDPSRPACGDAGDRGVAPLHRSVRGGRPDRRGAGRAVATGRLHVRRGGGVPPRRPGDLPPHAEPCPGGRGAAPGGRSAPARGDHDHAAGVGDRRLHRSRPAAHGADHHPCGGGRGRGTGRGADPRGLHPPVRQLAAAGHHAGAAVPGDGGPMGGSGDAAGHLRLPRARRRPRPGDRGRRHGPGAALPAGAPRHDR
jgi:hypothetical protein